MHNIKFVVAKEDKYYVSQCLNVDVSSFGQSVDEAISNLKEALELYFEDSIDKNYVDIQEVLVGESLVNA